MLMTVGRGFRGAAALLLVALYFQGCSDASHDVLYEKIKTAIASCSTSPPGQTCNNVYMETFLQDVQSLYVLQAKDWNEAKKQGEGPAFDKWRLLECNKEIATALKLALSQNTPGAALEGPRKLLEWASKPDVTKSCPGSPMGTAVVVTKVQDGQATPVTPAAINPVVPGGQQAVAINTMGKAALIDQTEHMPEEKFARRVVQ